MHTVDVSSDVNAAASSGASGRDEAVGEALVEYRAAATRLADTLGRLVRRYPAPTPAETLLDLRGLPAGLYLLQVGSARQRLTVE